MGIELVYQTFSWTFVFFKMEGHKRTWWQRMKEDMAVEALLELRNQNSDCDEGERMHLLQEEDDEKKDAANEETEEGNDITSSLASLDSSILAPVPFLFWVPPCMVSSFYASALAPKPSQPMASQLVTLLSVPSHSSAFAPYTRNQLSDTLLDHPLHNEAHINEAHNEVRACKQQKVLHETTSTIQLPQQAIVADINVPDVTVLLPVLDIKQPEAIMPEAIMPEAIMPEAIMPEVVVEKTTSTVMPATGDTQTTVPFLCRLVPAKKRPGTDNENHLLIRAAKNARQKEALYKTRKEKREGEACVKKFYKDALFVVYGLELDEMRRSAIVKLQEKGTTMLKEGKPEESRLVMTMKNTRPIQFMRNVISLMERNVMGRNVMNNGKIQWPVYWRQKAEFPVQKKNMLEFTLERCGDITPEGEDVKKSLKDEINQLTLQFEESSDVVVWSTVEKMMETTVENELTRLYGPRKVRKICFDKHKHVF